HSFQYDFNVDAIPWHFVRKLSFYGDEMETVANNFTKLRNLTELNLSDCFNITELDLLTRLKNLTSLKLEQCPNLLILYPISKLTKLTKLHLTQANYAFYGGIENLDTLASLTNLTDLQLPPTENYLQNVNALSQ